MKSLKQRLAMSAVMLALAATAFGANAQSETSRDENFENQVTAGSSIPGYTPAEHGTRTRAAKPASAESKQFEIFENELGAPSSVRSYTPSEHPDAAPAPRSAHPTPSVFDNPLNTEEGA